MTTITIHKKFKNDITRSNFQANYMTNNKIDIDDKYDTGIDLL